MSDNNEKTDNTQFDFNKFADTIETTLKVIRELPDTLKQAANNLNNVFEAIVELSNIDIDEFCTRLKNKETKVEDEVLAWGNIGWCLYGCDYDAPECVTPILGEVYNDNDSSKLDSEVMYYLQEFNAINNSIENIKHNLSSDDTNKFNEALNDFDNKRYYSCANMLCGIIDSLSIKQCAKDIETGVINNTCDASQGFNSFRKIINNHFNGKIPSLKTDDRKVNRHTELENRFKNHKFSLFNLYEISALFNLIMCMIMFFHNTAFKDYKINKPTVINRNWLSHGMYNLDDITEIDCIKLILILDQLSRLYIKLNSNVEIMEEK